MGLCLASSLRDATSPQIRLSFSASLRNLAGGISPDAGSSLGQKLLGEPSTCLSSPLPGKVVGSLDALCPCPSMADGSQLTPTGSYGLLCTPGFQQPLLPPEKSTPTSQLYFITNPTHVPRTYELPVPCIAEPTTARIFWETPAENLEEVVRKENSQVFKPGGG